MTMSTDKGPLDFDELKEWLKEYKLERLEASIDQVILYFRRK
jgi:hypothetical protein